MSYEIWLGALLSPIVVFGLLGNVLSVFVWTRGSQSRTSTAKFLSALAAVDAIVLLFPATELVVFLLSKTYLRDYSTFLCKIFGFLPFFGPQMSAWLVVWVTLERAISVWYPHKVRVMSTPRKAYIIILLTALVLTLLNIPMLIDLSVAKYIVPGHLNDTMATMSPEELAHLELHNTYVCMHDAASIFVQYLTFWSFLTQFLFLFLLPFIIIAVCNVIILVKIFFHRRYQNNYKDRKKKDSSRNTRIMGPLTARIVAMSVVHCISAAPLTILVLENTLRDIEDQNNSNYFLLRDVFNVLFYINSGINFVLYCIFGREFRKDLVEMITSRTLRPRRRRASSIYISNAIDKDYKPSKTSKSGRSM